MAPSRWPDVAQLLGAATPIGCQHAPFFPEDFLFCPTCGEALSAPGTSAVTVQPEWWGPGGEQEVPKHVPHGLPVCALPLSPRIESRALQDAPRPDLTIPTPPNAVCVFAAANYGFAAQRLLALATTRNVLQYWDPHARIWHVMTGDDGVDLRFTRSDYAWLPAAAARSGEARLGEVAIVPTDFGLFRLWINPVAESYRAEPVFQAPLASAPGMVRKQMACLFASASGIALWSAGPDGADPEVLPCKGENIPGAGWARPIRYDDKLMWLHAEGQVLWQPGADPLWLTWPLGWTPRLHFGGATQSRDGRLWQIGHDGHGYSFMELGVAGGQTEPIDGARLGFGTFLFRRGHPVMNNPWDNETVEDQNETDSLVLPLLQNYNGMRDQASGLVLRFEHYTGKAEAALAGAVLQKTSVEWIGQRNVVLDEIARLAHPAQCVPFLYDDALWLHHPNWNQIRGWTLKAQK